MSKKSMLSPLAKHLLLIVLIKIAILYCLWYTLIRPYKVKIDVEDINSIYSVQSIESTTSYQKEIQNDRR